MAIDLSITTIRSFERLGELEGEWHELLAKSQADTVFLCWPWVMSWLESYRASIKLEIRLLRTPAGVLMGIAPLCATTIRWNAAGPFRVLRLIGDGTWDSDYLDLISEQGSEGVVVEALFSDLNRSGRWDVLMLNEIPAESQTVPAVGAVSRKLGWSLRTEEVPCAYAELPGSFDELLVRLRPRFRTKVRSTKRKLMKEGGARVTYCTTNSELDGWLEELFRIHRLRWESVGQRGVFTSENKRRFYGRMSWRFLALGWLRFGRLDMEGRVAAMQFCFDYRGRTYLLQEGYDPALAPLNVGNVLRAEMFADAISEGITAYDFLGGVSEHKLNWGVSVKRSVRMTLCRPTARGRLYEQVVFGTERLKQTLKQRMPSSVVKALRRLRGGVDR